MKAFPGSWLITVIALFFPRATLLPAQPPPSKEYQIKAAFLFNFVHFVQWPPAAFPNAQTPLVIGVLGDDPFGAYLDEIVRGEKVNSHPVVIERYRRVEEINVCHLLFISRSERRKIRAIVTELEGRIILTGADFEGFSANGGIIRFLTGNNKIQFRINLSAAERAHLVVSSKLLRAAEISTR